MPKNEGNPNHPMTQAMEQQWHKIAALLLEKLGGSAVITASDVEALENKAIVILENDTGIHVKIVSPEEGQRLVDEEGGAPH